VIEYTFIVEDIPWRPRLNVTRVPDANNTLLTVHCEAGRACRIESTADFAQWQTLTNLIATSAGTTFAIPLAEHSKQFFRASITAP